MEKTNGKLNLEGLKKELRRVVLAGVGAAILARDGAAGLAKKWVAKGEEVEPELKKALSKLREKREQVTQKSGEGWKKITGYLPLVTKKDFSELVKRIDALTVKVEGLRPKRAK